MNKISEHISFSEIACHCGCGFGLAPGEFSPEMVRIFEILRSKLSIEQGHDCPIEIPSGCRCEAHNKAVGGALHSYHLLGMALDTLPPAGFSTDEWYDWLCAHYTEGGVISYDNKNIVHIDCRKGTPYRKDGHRNG